MAKTWLGLNEREGYFNRAIGEKNTVVFVSIPFRVNVDEKGIPSIVGIFKWIEIVPLGGFMQVVPRLDISSIGKLYAQSSLSFENIYEN